MRGLIHQAKRSAVWQRVFRARAADSLPHSITHQRIYIVPSKRGCAFLLMLLIMLIASTNYALSLGYALSFLLSGLFAASLLHTYKNVAGLVVSAIDVQDVFAGSSCHIKVTLENQQTRSRHGIRVSNNEASAQLVHADSESHAHAIVQCTPLKRGIYKPGRLTLQSDWPLGLWTCWSYLHVDREALVYPKPETEPPPLPLLNGSDSENRLKTAPTGDVSGLREYQIGDSVSSIAWKSVARGMGLKSRMFESESESTKTVLSLAQTDIKGLEAQLSRLCAWVLLAESSRTEYAVQLSSATLPEGLGKLHRSKALEALSRVDYASKHAPSA